MTEIITSNLFTGEVEVTETEECFAEIETSKLYRNKTDDNITIDNVTMLESKNDEPSSIRLTTQAVSSETSLVVAVEDNHNDDIYLNLSEYTKKGTKEK